MKEKQELPHPLQPLVSDSKGVLRFKANAIVEWASKSASFDLNRVLMQPNPAFSKEDQCQFMQLLGYSYSGYCEQPCVDDAEYLRVREVYDKTCKELLPSHNNPEENCYWVVRFKVREEYWYLGYITHDIPHRVYRAAAHEFKSVVTADEHAVIAASYISSLDARVSQVRVIKVRRKNG